MEELASRQYLTLPNAFTLLRLCCIPLFLYLLFGRDNRAGAAWLLGALGATDWVDGWLARRFHQTSEFGKAFDPATDRLLFIVGIAAWGCAIPGVALSYYTALRYVPTIRAGVREARLAREPHEVVG
jgi:phosphatidylglycerophosphate synthase